jgi:hypothetical protein
MKGKIKIANNATMDFKNVNPNGENVLKRNLDSMDLI